MFKRNVPSREQINYLLPKYNRNFVCVPNLNIIKTIHNFSTVSDLKSLQITIVKTMIISLIYMTL